MPSDDGGEVFSVGGGRTNVLQLYGGLGLQLRGKNSFPEMSFPDSVKDWQDSSFYCQDVRVGEGQSGLPPYLAERIQSAPSFSASKEEKVDVDILVIALILRKGSTGWIWKPSFSGESNPSRLEPTPCGYMLDRMTQLAFTRRRSGRKSWRTNSKP